MSFGSSVQYSSKYTTTLGNDADTIQPAFAKWNANLSVKANSGAWELALIGNNLTDRYTTGNCTLFDAAGWNVLGDLSAGVSPFPPIGRPEAACIADPGRQVYLRLTASSDGILMDVSMKSPLPEHSQAALIQELAGLRDLVEASADERDEASEISPEVIHALEESGLFGLMAPAELGGLEAHPLTVIDALRTLSYFDGSTGWYCQAATTGVAVAGAFLGDRAIEAIFCSGKRATCAGQAAPSGKAERVSEGYRISGIFSFGSGLPNAAWVVGGYILHEDGMPVKRETASR